MGRPTIVVEKHYVWADDHTIIIMEETTNLADSALVYTRIIYSSSDIIQLKDKTELETKSEQMKGVL